MPPSKGVPSGPWMRASQRKMSSSEMGPAVMPSGGAEARFLYSEKRRRDATVDAIFRNLGGDRGTVGGKSRRGNEKWLYNSGKGPLDVWYILDTL